MANKQNCENVEGQLLNSSENLTRNSTRFFLNYVARFFVAGVVFYVCYIAFANYNYWFSWHVIFCTVGYIPLMAESIMLFTGDEIWSHQISRKAKYLVHGILALLGTGLIVVGDGVVFHFISPGYHLYTAHGITGLVSLVLLILSIPIGLAINYQEKLKNYLSIRLVWIKAMHNSFGLLAYVIGIISLCLSYYTQWFIYCTDYGTRLVLLVFTLLSSVWSLNGAVVSLYHQIKSILS